MDKSTLSQTSALRWTLVGLTAALVYLCWSLWPALVLAAWTAALARPLLVRIERRLKAPRRAVALLTLLLFLVLSLPLGLIVLAAVFGVQELVHVISDAIAAQPTSAKSAIEAVAAAEAAPQFPRSLPAASELVQRYGAQAVNVLTKLAGAAATGLVAVFIYFGGAFVFLLEGPAVWSWCKRHAPLESTHLERLSAAFHETGRGLLVGVGLTSATQGLVATLVYLALGIPRWWVLGPITGLASMLPLIGSALVWAPIAIGLFLTGHRLQAVILAVLGVAVISTVDNVLRPIYARMGALQVPTLALFVSIFGAIAVVGPWGAILGPLVLRLWLEVLALRDEAKAADVIREMGANALEKDG